jgi:hypothetical protein
VLPSNAK